MMVFKNKSIPGEDGKPILLDYGFKPSNFKKPVVIFVHGFKGFKDWGHFNKVMNYFIQNNFVFLKFNFSHNGTTEDQPEYFADLEAFGNNNYTKELSDLKTVIDWISNLNDPEIDTNHVCLIGHSRGGAISILSALEDNRIKQLITWAAVSDLINRYSQDDIKQCEKEGALFIENSRTKQKMPLYYQFFEDIEKNKSRFDIQNRLAELKIPYLILHGSDDPVVQLQEANRIKSWSQNAEITIVKGANHSFGASHPYTLEELPKHVEFVLKKTLDFIRR
jgi:dipeptidyl aminopeptidase/acylaminoacyl peptidase